MCLFKSLPAHPDDDQPGLSPTVTCVDSSPDPIRMPTPQLLATLSPTVFACHQTNTCVPQVSSKEHVGDTFGLALSLICLRTWPYGPDTWNRVALQPSLRTLPCSRCDLGDVF